MRVHLSAPTMFDPVLRLYSFIAHSGLPCYLRTQSFLIQTRVLRRRDLVTAAQLLKSARVEFRSAGDSDGTAEVDAALIKIKVDIVVQAMGAAREVLAVLEGSSIGNMLLGKEVGGGDF